MTLLTICTNAANDAGVAAPSSIIGNTDPAAVRLLQLARRSAISIARRANWTQLVTEHTFTADGTSDYSLPSDFRSLVGDTLWDRSRFWQMRGAMSPSQWQMYKSSIFSRASIERRWRIRIPSGAVSGSSRVFSIDPSVAASDITSQFVFEYVSNNWGRSGATFGLVRAVPYDPGSGYALGDTVTLTGGAVVQVAAVDATGITGAEIVTPGAYIAIPASPVGQSGTSGGGSGATFVADTSTFAGTPQSNWAADTDTAIMEDFIEMGVIWRLLARLGLAYLEEKEEFERELDKAVARDGGTAILNVGPQTQYWDNSYSVADGAFSGAVILTDDLGNILTTP